MKDGKQRYMNYKNLIFGIKNYYYKLFSHNQFYLLNFEKSLYGYIQPLLELSVIKTELNILLDQKRDFKSNIYVKIGQYESFWTVTELYVFVIY